MSQNDFNIANQGFPATRADINSALQALASTSAGATAPSTTYAYQLWYDTSTNLLKMRNADNDGFITLAAFDQTADEWEVRSAVIQAVDSAGVVIKTDDGTTRLTVADNGNVTLANDLVVTGTVQSSNISATGSMASRNKIINGNFDIWQRGTSFSGNEYGADRWVNAPNGSSMTQSRQSFTLGQTDVPNEPAYFCRSTVTSSAGAGNYAILVHRVEGVRTLAGQTCTLSFWAKADASKNIAVEFAQYFGSGGSPSSAANNLGTTTCSLTTSWQKFTVTVSLPSISGKTLGTNNNDYLTLNLWFDAGSNFNSRTNSLGQQSGTFDIAQVQLEAGDVATPFEVRHIGQELALCQRYYQKSYKTSDFAGSAVTDGAIVAVSPVTNCRIPVFLQVPMRTLPTVTFFSPATGSSGVVRDDTGGVDVSLSGAGFLSEKSFLTSGLNLAAVDREVRFQYTVDAEL